MPPASCDSHLVASEQRGKSYSDVMHQIAHADLQGLGNSQESGDAYSLLAAFQFPDVDGMEVCFLRELFLCKPCVLSVSADRISNQLLIARFQWHAVRKQ